MKESLKIGRFTYPIHLDVILSLTDVPFSIKFISYFLWLLDFLIQLYFQIIRKEERGQAQVKKEFSSSSVIQVKQHSWII